MEIVLKPVRTSLAMSAIVAALTVANSTVLWIKFRYDHDTLFGLTPLFDFNREGNLPSFYSACALLLCAFLFGMVASHAVKVGDRWRRHWVGLTWIFVFLAIDEAAELHGLLSLPLGGMLHASGAMLFTWVIAYGVLVVLFGVTYVRFWLALPPRLRLQLGVAGVIYVFAALGLEAVGGAIVSAHGGYYGGGLGDWRHAIEYTCEEFLEMAAIVLAVYALLCHIETHRITASVRTFAKAGD